MAGVELGKPVREQSDEILRELLLRRTNEVTHNNQRFETIAATMQNDAAVFARTMLEVDAAHDVAHDSRRIAGRGLFGRDSYQDIQVPVWFIRTKEKYGGGDLDQRNPGARAGTTKRRLVIRQTGELALVSWYSSHDIGPSISAEPKLLPANEFINRDAADSGAGEQAIRKKWQQHLEEAAQRYTRLPFVKFDIRKI